MPPTRMRASPARRGSATTPLGPGATNLVTGIANAFMDSVPLVCVTGQVISALIGRDGFQEADIQGITIPITKHNELVRHVDEIPRAMQELSILRRPAVPGLSSSTSRATCSNTPASSTGRTRSRCAATSRTPTASTRTSWRRPPSYRAVRAPDYPLRPRRNPLMPSPRSASWPRRRTSP